MWNLDLCLSLTGPLSSSLRRALTRCCDSGSEKLENLLTQCSDVHLYISCTWHSFVTAVESHTRNIETLVSYNVYPSEFNHGSVDGTLKSHVILIRSV